jgi:hypothetical protein
MAGVLNLVKTPGFWVCAGLGPFQKKENDGLFERMTTENVNSEKKDHWKCEFWEKGPLKMWILRKGTTENVNSPLKI